MPGWLKHKHHHKEKSLFQAIKDNNEGLVKKLLFKGNLDLNYLDYGNMSPLLRAIEKKNVTMVESLLVHGADPNQKCPEKEASLHYASCCGLVEIGELLLKHGAQVDQESQEDGRKMTPLDVVCHYGESVEMAQMLIAYGANVNHQNEHMDSPLEHACWSNSVKLVELLLQHGADPNHPNRKKSNSLFVACHYSGVEVVQLLVMYAANINQQNVEGQTPLHFACIYKTKEIVELFLENSAQIDSENNDLMTPLFCACEKGKKDIVELLLDRGADINHRDNKGFTPLLWACHEGQAKVAELLVDRGANIWVKNMYGDGAWDLVVENEHKEKFKVLKDVLSIGNMNCSSSHLEPTNVNNFVVVQQQLNLTNELQQLNISKEENFEKASPALNLFLPSSSQKEQQQNDCSICLDQKVNKTAVNRCGHTFCYACIKKHNDNSNSCPNCNGKIESLLKLFD